MNYFENMLCYFIEVNICLILFYLLYILLFKKETFFNLKRGYLLGIIFLSFLIPSLQFNIIKISQPIGPYLELIPNTVEQIINTQAEAIVDSEFITIEPSTISSKANIPIHLILLYVYTFISALLFLKLIRSIWAVYKTIKHSKKIKTETYTIVQVGDLKSPYSFFKYLFWNDTFDDQDYILKHEEIHMNQRHSVDVLIYEVLAILFWINPFVFLLKKEAKRNLEHIADAFTNESTKDSYAQLLLKFVNKPSKRAIANRFNSEIKNRITMMYAKQSRKYKLLNFVFLIPVLMGMSVLFAFQQNSASNFSDENVSNSESFQFSTKEKERNHPYRYEVHFGAYKFYIQKQRENGSGVTFMISDRTASKLMKYKPLVYDIKNQTRFPLTATYHSDLPYIDNRNTLKSLNFNHNQNTHTSGKQLLIRDIKVEDEDQLYGLSFAIFSEDKIKVNWGKRNLSLNQTIQIPKTEFIEKSINMPIQSNGYIKREKQYFKEIEINKVSGRDKVIDLRSFPVRQQPVLVDITEKIIRNIEVGDKITLKEIRIESPSIPSTYWITFQIIPDDPNTKDIPPSAIGKNKVTYLLNGEVSDKHSIESLNTDQILEIKYYNKFGETNIKREEALIISIKTKK